MRPKLRLSRLRDIGWKHWDPIGLLGEGASWQGEPFADEYDGYLIHAAGQVRQGTPDAEIAAYLCDVEANAMGLGVRSDTEVRAQRVVSALRDSPDLWS